MVPVIPVTLTRWLPPNYRMKRDGLGRRFARRDGQLDVGLLACASAPRTAAYAGSLGGSREPFLSPTAPVLVSPPDLHD
jgi:hypothetical protein